MTPHDSLLNTDWGATVDRCGGAASLSASARETKGFQRAREVPDAATLRRMVLAYCLGQHGLRLTAAWAVFDGPGEGRLHPPYDVRGHG